MKKFKPLLVASLLLGGVLVSCGGSENNGPTINPDGGNEDDKPSKPDEKPEPQVDFTIKTSCDAGSFDKEEYLLSEVDPNDDYYNFNDPELKITITSKNWSNTTGILESDVRILSENSEALPVDAVTWETEDTLTGSGGSNVIVAINLKIDRTKLKEGETKLKVYFKPSNGSTSAEIVDLCVPIKVVKYGAIVSELTKATFEVNLSGLPSEFEGRDLGFGVIVNGDDYNYGSNFDKNIEIPFTKDDLVFEDVTIPLNHRVSFDIRTLDDKTPYKVKVLKLENDSSFEVVEDEYGEEYIFKSTVTNTLKAKF